MPGWDKESLESQLPWPWTAETMTSWLSRRKVLEVSGRWPRDSWYRTGTWVYFWFLFCFVFCFFLLLLPSLRILWGGGWRSLFLVPSISLNLHSSWVVIVPQYSALHSTLEFESEKKKMACGFLFFSFLLLLDTVYTQQPTHGTWFSKIKHSRYNWSIKVSQLHKWL